MGTKFRNTLLQGNTKVFYMRFMPAHHLKMAAYFLAWFLFYTKQWIVTILKKAKRLYDHQYKKYGL